MSDELLSKFIAAWTFFRVNLIMPRNIHPDDADEQKNIYIYVCQTVQIAQPTDTLYL